MNASLAIPFRSVWTRWHWHALLGGAAWLPAVVALGLGWGAAMLLLAALVLLPLSFVLVRQVDAEARSVWLWLEWLHLPAAGALVAAFAFPQGVLPALLSVPWLLLTAGVAWIGAQRLLQPGRSRPEYAALTAALLYLPVGGMWTVLSRYGARPLEFSDVIVQATAVHFHYAGFVLPIVTGLLARKFSTAWTTATVWGVIVGVPLVAAGITLSALGVKYVELAAAWLMALSGIAVAVLQLRLSGFAAGRPQAFLWIISGLSLLFGMLLAVIYALGMATGREWLDIPQMLPYHGAVNALGFALPALLAWNLELRPPAIDGRDENHHS